MLPSDPSVMPSGTLLEVGTATSVRVAAALAGAWLMTTAEAASAAAARMAIQRGKRPATECDITCPSREQRMTGYSCMTRIWHVILPNRWYDSRRVRLRATDPAAAD